jgi:hypothetical protein
VANPGDVGPGLQGDDRAGDLGGAAADFGLAPAGFAPQGDDEAAVEDLDPAAASRSTSRPTISERRRPPAKPINGIARSRSVPRSSVLSIAMTYPGGRPPSDGAERRACCGCRRARWRLAVLVMERRPALGVSPSQGGEAALDLGDGIRPAIGRPRARGAAVMYSPTVSGEGGNPSRPRLGRQPSKCFQSEAYARRMLAALAAAT